MMDQDVNQFQNLIDGLVTDDQPDPAYRRELREKLLQQFDAPKTRTLHLVQRKVLQYAAAVALVLSVGAVFFMMTVGHGPGIAFADVQRKLRDAKTMSCILTMTGKATVYVGSATIITKKQIVDEKGNVVKENVEEKSLDKKFTKPRTVDIHLKMKITTREPGLLRVDMIQGNCSGDNAGSYTIVDSKNGKMLFVDTKQKIYLKDKSNTASPAGAFEKLFRKYMDKIQNADAESLGEKTIDGKKTVAYKIKGGEVRADAKTAAPIQIQFDNKDENGNVSKVTISGIRINEPLDDSVFSMDIPEGFNDMCDIQLKDNQGTLIQNKEIEVHIPSVTAE